MNPAPSARHPQSTGQEPGAHRRARALLARAVSRLPEDRREWGEAMLAELEQITSRVRAVTWALGGFRVARQARLHHRRQHRQGGPLMAGMARKTRRGAVLWWALWAAVTTLLAFEFPTLAILFGLAGLVAARLLRPWPEGAAGALAGAGAVCLLIGLLNFGGGRSCPSSPVTGLSGVLAAPASQASSCGGVASLPLLAAGGLSIAAGLLLYWASARRAPR
jgi:hypothetical protein